MNMRGGEERAAASDHAGPQRRCHRCGAGMHVELVVDDTDAGSHRVDAHVQPAGRRLILSSLVHSTPPALTRARNRRTPPRRPFRSCAGASRRGQRGSYRGGAGVRRERGCGQDVSVVEDSSHECRRRRRVEAASGLPGEYVPLRCAPREARGVESGGVRGAAACLQEWTGTTRHSECAGGCSCR
jgi:hypothetical protein